MTDDNASNDSVITNDQIDYLSMSNNTIDIKPPTRYSITIAQARNRALRAIKKSRQCTQH